MQGDLCLKAWPALAILIIQIILFLGHWLVYATWVAFWPCLAPESVPALRVAMLVLAFSFVAASLLAFRYSNATVRLAYGLAAVWLGFLNFFFWASLPVWIAWLVLRLLHPADLNAMRPLVAAVFYVPAFLAGVYGLISACVIRIRRISVSLPNLPASWRGRRAVVFSDFHLGPIHGARFCRRLAVLAARFQPDIVFLPGDLFDGTKADLDSMIAPLRDLTPPLGIFFSTGNHEEFTDPTHYLEAVSRAGIHVLANELVDVDGVQIAGLVNRLTDAATIRLTTNAKAAVPSANANSLAG
jgi:uncharacterized protein